MTAGMVRDITLITLLTLAMPTQCQVEKNESIIFSAGANVTVEEGLLDVHRSSFPVMHATRTAEGVDATDEENFKRGTRSGLATTRKSTLYDLSTMEAGFGADVSFQVEGSDRTTTELGVIGMMMTGDGSPSGDFVFKSWGTATPDFLLDVEGAYNRLVIKSTGDVVVPDGLLDVHRASFPVMHATRIGEGVNDTDEENFKRGTRSGLATTRKSTLYDLSTMEAGFGADVSFQVQGSDGTTTELGVIGMMTTGDGSASGDFVFKSWGTATPDFLLDAEGEYNRLVIKSTGDVLVPSGDLIVKGVSFEALNAEVSDLQDDYNNILVIVVVLCVILFLFCIILAVLVARLMMATNKAASSSYA